ncbi:MAG TPA: S41 family peptidase [Candidatus Sulfotelmatobacter sp.]|nr:S41 family peptidase [Candidatus Sulfotelmatobacter sp.]
MARSSRRSLLLVLFFLLVCGFLGILFAQRTGQQSSMTGDSDVKDSLKQFTDVYSLVEENYAEPVNPDKAIYNGAIPGMLHALDPHSNFFDPKNYALMREDQRGKYYGVGMTVGPRNNQVIVIYPFVGTPAYKAGIHPGDVIVAVDGKSTENMSTGDVADLLKGPKGTTVHISIMREGVEKPMEFTLMRDEIPRYSVDLHFMIKPGIGYMHVNGFNETTEHEVAEALDQFGDLKGLILDLRGNPGGLLSEAVGVSDKFLKKGQVVVSHHGRASAEHRYIAQHGNGGREYPIVVLVNRLTASAAEIVSGAIQDHDRGLIVGEVTFGKGLVQTVYPLSENTGLALTTARYYTPSGRLIQRDYSNISLYDYYYNRDAAEQANNANKEVKLTDSGRTVYGGGGITPDVTIPPVKTNHFQDTLLQHYAFFNFAKRYVVNHHPTKNMEVDDAMLQDFRKSLDEANIAYTQADLIDNNDWIRANIKSEIFVDAFGQDEGMKVRAESDPEVIKGLDLLPQAKALAENAKKIVAEHNAAAPGFSNR